MGTTKGMLDLDGEDGTFGSCAARLSARLLIH